MKKIKKIFAAVLTLLGLQASSCAAPAWTDMSASDFDAYIHRADVQLLDVRTESEFWDGHLEGALNIDVLGRNFMGNARAALDKSKPVAVYCRSGKRSAKAAAKLTRAGYRVTNLEGGILAWQESGKKVVK